MGWTFCSPNKTSLITEIKHRLTRPTAWDDGSFIDPHDISVVGNTLYALLQRPAGDYDGIDYPDGLRVILVFLLKGSGTRDRWAWGYKDMSEDMGPCIATCPKKLLARSNCQSSYAVEWRQSCLDWHSGKLARAQKVAALADGLYDFDVSGPTVSPAERAWFEQYGTRFRLENGKWYTPRRGSRIRAPKTWGLRYNATPVVS